MRNVFHLADHKIISHALNFCFNLATLSPIVPLCLGLCLKIGQILQKPRQCC